MRRKVRALSPEGRASAVFLSVVLVLTFTFTSISTLSYLGGAHVDPLFIGSVSV